MTKIFLPKTAQDILFYVIFADCITSMTLATLLGCGCIAGQVVLQEDISLKDKKIERAPAGTRVPTSVVQVVETPPPLVTPKVSDISKLFAVSDNGRWGMVNLEGNFAIPSVYDAMKAVSCNHVAVKYNGKWGYLNKKGILETPCVLEEASSYENGYALILQNGRWGMIDSTGKSCIRCDYNQLHPVREGLVAACSEGLWGFLDTKGSLEIPFAYEAVTDFHNGRAGFRINGKWGIMNRKGEILIDARFDNVEW